MTLEIALVLGILAAVLLLLVTERIRPDLLALFVLSTLAISGLVSPAQALAGFGNAAVVTVWAMFMVSEALTRTGVASIVGRAVERWTGRGEARAALVIMVTGGVLSAFMNNIGVAALLLPVVMQLARSSGRSPSRLLMPLAYGTLLGGLTTLVGTPPNLLASEALRSAGRAPFALFDFSPIGVPAMLVGSLFVAFVARRFLPARAGSAGRGAERRLREQYGLGHRTVVLRVPPGARLQGRTLRASRLGTAAQVSVFAVQREGHTETLPGPDFVLRGGDRLLIGGRLDRFNELKQWRALEILDQAFDLSRIASEQVRLVEIELAAGSELEGRTVVEVDFRNRYGGTLLALRRGGDVVHADPARTPLAAGDRMLLQTDPGSIEKLRELAGVALDESRFGVELTEHYGLHGRVFTVGVAADSVLIGETLAESGLGAALRLRVLGILRPGQGYIRGGPEARLEAGDRLLVRGEPDDVEALRALQELEVAAEAPLDLDALRSERVDLVEAVVSPHAHVLGRTLEQLGFRTRYGCHLLAIHRGGRARWTNLRELQLQAGDALLLLGPPDRLAVLEADPDFVVLTPPVYQPVRGSKGPLAAVIMAVALATVLLGWLPIAIAAVAASALLLLFGCLTMEEAYRAVEWRSIFLIGGMLPLGDAMESTGAANWLALRVMDATAAFGAWGALVGLYLVTSLATMIVPTAALIVILAPIAIRTASDLGVSPESFVMAVAMAASASFTSPVSHPANLLVMGPGGYSFRDYLKVGVPLTVVVGVVVLALLPVFWPF